jgi:hypothetical protein
VIAARPLAIGEIFDRAVMLVVRRWRSVAPLLVLLAAEPAVRAVLVAADPRFTRHAPFGSFVLQTVNVLTTVFATAAMYRVFGAEDNAEDPWRALRWAFGEGWRLLRAMLLVGVVMTALSAVGFFLTFFAFRVARGPGSMVSGALFVVVFGLVITFGQLVLADAVLEGTGATVSFLSALERVRAAGTKRSLLLGAAAFAAQAVPGALVLQVIRQLTMMQPGLRWSFALSPVLSAFTGTLFFTAVITVAAIDYRLRREGTDLEAALEAAAPA